MAKSIKLTDNQYIDAEGVYDHDLGLGQNTLNAYSATRRSFYSGYSSSIKIRVARREDKTFLFIVGNANGYSCVSLIFGTDNVLNLGDKTLSVTTYTVGDDYFEYVLSGFNSWGAYCVISYDRIISISNL